MSKKKVLGFVLVTPMALIALYAIGYVFYSGGLLLLAISGIALSTVIGLWLLLTEYDLLP